MAKITIIYPDEFFGEVSVYINDILIDSMKSNTQLSFEVYKGKNVIKIKVTGSDYSAYIQTFDIPDDMTFVIDGYYSRKRFRLYALIFITTFVFVLVTSFLLFVSFALHLILIALGGLLIGMVSHSIYFFYIKKQKYVYLKLKT